jgi:hypothetical protein
MQQYNDCFRRRNLTEVHSTLSKWRFAYEIFFSSSEMKILLHLRWIFFFYSPETAFENRKFLWTSRGEKLRNMLWIILQSLTVHFKVKISRDFLICIKL